MRADIIGAMKNAMDRGATPQQAARSLINSGYPPQEVNEALKFITGGTLSSLTPQPRPQFQKSSMMRPAQQSQTPQKPMLLQQQPQQIPQTQQPLQRPPMQQLPVLRPQYQFQPKSKGGFKTFLLFAVLIILIGALVAAIFFKDEILKLLG